MKNIINVIGLVLGLIFAVAGYIIASKYSPSIGLSGLSKTTFSFAGALPGIAMLFIFDGDYEKNLRWLTKPVAASVWGWRIIGAMIVVVGGGLVIGNRSGQYLTFPYAGSIVVIIGFLIIGFKGTSR